MFHHIGTRFHRSAQAIACSYCRLINIVDLAIVHIPCYHVTLQTIITDDWRIEYLKVKAVHYLYIKKSFFVKYCFMRPFGDLNIKNIKHGNPSRRRWRDFDSQKRSISNT